MNIPLLRDSFEALKPCTREMAAHFFRTLFGKHPEARSLFRSLDAGQQQEALVHALAFVVENVDRPEALKGYLESQGRRHSEYGVTPEQYGWAAESLLSTLKYFFEETWTAELEETWAAALALVAKSMAEAKPAPVAPAGVGEEFQRSVNRFVQDALLRALRDPKVQEEVRKAAAAQAQKLLHQALQEELQQIKKEVQPKSAA